MPSDGLKISYIEAWFAPPPIQLPAKVVMPLQIASGPCPPTASGDIAAIVIKASGPPIITPTVPVKNIISAFGPSLKTSFKSILNVSKIKLAGRKKREAT